ncbi:ATP-binding protein [Actinokineospora bangkokensis]|uniref:HTH luxR-type domain-containing protein n=1 Tax=Actinokineospora bangkokensis TaxID=1193682 RepID=A0A1Q9LHP7_9PSEU|nr:LuxR C-terminal-related transcriptional regulator [Actinokineospora bangkokensis]OLR91577.1 hypothetical protein BJP25_25780 [Actinokineospora bangkokensis]
MGVGGYRTGGAPTAVAAFVGRGAEIEQVRARLRAARVLTVHGAGGVGKTELALRVGRELEPEFPGGVHFADLTPVADPDTVEALVADALGVRDQSSRPVGDALVDYLRGPECLLVLDNCEHLVPAVADLVTDLLARVPRLRVLATSREAPLGAPDEHLLRLDPLPVPELGATTEELAGFDAVRLLRDRAAAAGAALEPTDRNRDAVVRLVRGLDGMPLAITLAAARLRTLTVEQLVDRLDRVLHLLGTGAGLDRHQRTLAAVVEWSSQLCDPAERLVWQRCSVFEAGFDLDDAEAVCAADPIDRDRVLDLVDGLVRKSILVKQDGEGVACYRMLETTRQYGVQRLAERGELAEVRERHLAHYAALARRAAREWFGPRELDWLTRVLPDFPNLRAAMRHAAEVGDPRGLQLAVDLAALRVWFFRGPIREGYQWLRTLLAATPGVPVDLRTRALTWVCWMAACMGDKHQARAALTEVRALPAGNPAALFAEGCYRMLIEQDPTGVPVLDRAAAELCLAGRPGDAHMAALFTGMGAAFLGSRREAAAATRRADEAARERRAPWAVSWTRWTAALTELLHGTPDRALGLFRTSLREQRAMGERWGTAWSAHGVAWAMSAKGEPARAALLLGATRTLRAATGVHITTLTAFGALHAKVERTCLRALGPIAFRDAFERGAALTPDEGLAAALDEPLPTRDPWAEVTARERQVAQLAAKGLSTKEIAAELRIGDRTVETHLRRLLPKLGLRRRAQLAHWMAENR